MATRKALIVGGGVGGMSAAIALRGVGIDVDLIDIDPDWKVYGAGLTITGPTLRALGQLGVLEAVLSQGFAADGVVVRNLQGEVVSAISTPVRGADGVPGTGGIMRPVLHAILASQVRQCGATVRLGLTITGLDQDDGGADVAFSDGGRGRYDLVVGADGVFSTVRELIFPAAPKPQYTGQACWRLRLPRPPELTQRCFFLGGPVKVGLTPVSADEMYMFVLETSPVRRRQAVSTQHEDLRRLLLGFGGMIGEIRDSLSSEATIVYRPLEAFLLPPPWFVGHTVLIGDAAHPTTPQLASGAGLAVEDALVLAQALAAASTVPAALDAFMARRWPRCRLVVETSLEIGRREQAGAPIAAQTELVERALAALAEPI